MRASAVSTCKVFLTPERNNPGARHRALKKPENLELEDAKPRTLRPVLRSLQDSRNGSGPRQPGNFRMSTPSVRPSVPAPVLVIMFAESHTARPSHPPKSLKATDASRGRRPVLRRPRTWYTIRIHEPDRTADFRGFRGTRKLAERVGFEPTVRCYPYTPLAGERLRPLGHLSADCRVRPGRANRAGRVRHALAF